MHLINFSFLMSKMQLFIFNVQNVTFHFYQNIVTMVLCFLLTLLHAIYLTLN